MRTSIRWYPQQEFDQAKGEFSKTGRYNLAVEVYAPCGCKVRGLYQAPSFPGKINSFPGVTCSGQGECHLGQSSKLASECTKLAFEAVRSLKRSVKPAEDIPNVGAGDISDVAWSEYT